MFSARTRLSTLSELKGVSVCAWLPARRLGRDGVNPIGANLNAWCEMNQESDLRGVILTNPRRLIPYQCCEAA
jgi:hypothetical protein